VLLFNHSDIKLQEFLIDASYPSADLLRGIWKLLRDKPQLGKLGPYNDQSLPRPSGRGSETPYNDQSLPRPSGRGSETPYNDELEQRLRNNLEGNISGATMGAAIRILERHGMLSRDDEKLYATRPEPNVYPPLDVQSLARRAEVERSKLRTMVAYAYYPRCRRQMVLEYFGDQDWASRDKQCGHCDNCEALAHGRPVASALSESEQKAIRSLLLLIGTLHGRFGRKRVAQIATGTIEDARFDDLVERGSLRGWKEQQVMDLLRALEGAGLIEASRGEYPTISTTRQGDQVAVKLDLGDLGIQMPTVSSKRNRRRRS